MSERALVVRATPDGWIFAKTAWHDDQHVPYACRPMTDGCGTVKTFMEVVERLDFDRFEGVYRRNTLGKWTQFLAVWLAIEPLLGEPLCDPHGDGALVAIRSARDAANLRTWVRSAKASVADAVATGEIQAMQARNRLLVALRRRVDASRILTPLS